VSARVTIALVPLLWWATPLAAQVTLQVGGTYLDRRLADGAAVERQAGMLAGGGIRIALKSVAFTVSGNAGTLTAKTARTPDADYARLGAELSAALAPWFAASVGIAASVYVTPVGAQRWILPRVGAELRLPFASIPGTAYLAGAALVGPTSNALVPARGGTDIRAGVSGGPSRVSVFAEYHLERLRFETGVAREEQRGEVTAGLRITP